jgi:hypothetical protein
MADVVKVFTSRSLALAADRFHPATGQPEGVDPT